jgi:hypothetical protein
MTKYIGRRPVVDATTPLTLTIKSCDAKIGIPKDPFQCVVWQAAKARLSDIIEDAQVGPHVTLIYTPTKIIRYLTPAPLARAIPVFDRQGQWNLEPGDYTLRVPKGQDRQGHRKQRFHKIKNTGRSQDKWGGRRLQPTRRVSVYQVNPHQMPVA